jgi:hypothetical protein
MKFIKLIPTLFLLLIAFSCEQEILVQEDPVVEPPTGEPGSADFTKFVSIGNSLTAGFQAGALFTEGQENSYPAIMAEHFAYVSDNDPFDQPTVNGSVNGCSNPTGGCSLGRFILYDADGPTGPKSAGPAPAGTPGMPAPYNTTAADHGLALAPFTGDKTALNNFGVPGIILAQALTPATGGPPPPAPNPAYNPYFARFAITPSADGLTGSTIMSDALSKNPTFVSFWLGNNDVLGYAVGGASNPAILTPAATFTAQYGAAIDAILALPNVEIVVGNIPNVTTIPYFKLVPYNPVVITDAGQIDAINAGYAPYNAGLDAAFTGGAITAEERDKRKVSFAVGQNPVVIEDESLTNLSGLGLPNYREATAQDLVVLTAGSYIGTLVGGDPTKINGVTVPLADQWVLIPTEITEITTRINDFNASIAAKVSANSSRIALADIHAKFTELASSPSGLVVDGVVIKSTFAPPNGIFSEDGVHPNNKGSAYIAKIFIQAINAKFGASVPEPNISKYAGTFVPTNPAE